MNTMELDGYHAKIEYDSELNTFRGEILGLTGGADFYGKKSQRIENRIQEVTPRVSGSLSRKRYRTATPLFWQI